MKCLLVVAEGMADEPLAALKGATPLQAARLPAADRMAREGRLGRACFAPEGLRGLESALLAVLGHDLHTPLPSLGILEAAGRGIRPAPGEAVFRADFVTVSEGRLADVRAGGVRPEEAQALAAALNAGLGEPACRVIPGAGHRGLLLAAMEGAAATRCASPQEALEAPVARHWPREGAAAALKGLMERSHAILDGHEVNQVRRDLGENPANLLWIWGGGEAAGLPAFAERFRRQGALVATADHARGAGVLAGMRVLDSGSAGELPGRFRAKAARAMEALAGHDVVVVHVQAPLEAALAGDAAAKVAALEALDAEILAPALEAAASGGHRVALATPCMASTTRRNLLPGEVPVALWGPGFAPRREGLAFDEVHAAASDLRVEAGHEFLDYLLGHPV